jgi:hypothetical protein
MKKHKEKDCSGTVPVRLSPAQVRVLVPALNLLVYSYLTHKRSGSSPLAYPFRIYPPPPGFDPGVFKDGICGVFPSLDTFAMAEQ